MNRQTDEVEVSDNPAMHRYEIRLNGQRAGFAEYRLAEGIINFVHTQIDPAFEGRGLASALVRYALDDVRHRGARKVKAVCPYVASWIARHPEYQDLLQAGPSLPDATRR